MSSTPPELFERDDLWPFGSPSSLLTELPNGFPVSRNSLSHWVDGRLLDGNSYEGRLHQANYCHITAHAFAGEFKDEELDDQERDEILSDAYGLWNDGHTLTPEEAAWLIQLIADQLHWELSPSLVERMRQDSGKEN